MSRGFPPVHPLRASLGGLAFLALLVGVGCQPEIGDSCRSDGDCARRMFCERSMPGGYCTVSGCPEQSCPGSSICVHFRQGRSFCMKTCGGDGGCRSAYECVEGVGARPICHVGRAPRPPRRGGPGPADGGAPADGGGREDVPMDVPAEDAPQDAAADR